jgi:hypothetical protein
VVVLVPIKVAVVAVHRRVSLGESVRDGARVGLSLTPTLVFTMVIADILRERFALAPHLYGALLVFTLLNTTLPGLVLRARTTLPVTATMPPPRAADAISTQTHEV